MATVFARYLPATRRTYSSFFSSKPGGGRYFNSAKPPKPVVATKTNGNTTSGKKSEVSKDGAPAAAAASASPKADDSASSLQSSSTSPPASTRNGDTSSSASSSSGTANSSSTSSAFRQANQLHPTLPSHPIINAKDFKLHQFFSLHRPLLLINDPAAILQTASHTSPLFSPPSSPSPNSLSDASIKNALNDPKSLLHTGQATSADDTVDATVDADAEAARLLARALTMSRAGSVAQWEDTLIRLGLDPALEQERIQAKEQMDKEWEDVLMDSTQRKRRKKMKKHKLKKRRRLTRASRLKMGK